MKNTSQNDAGFETVLRLLNARTGLTFRPEQRDVAQRGIEQSMARANVISVHEFARLLEHDSQVLDDLVVELTIGETYFFREPHQLDYIKSEILPEIYRRRGNNHTIRVWCAGCASGEEPYSLAMLCKTAGITNRTHILATDVSSEALEKARAASYREWSLRGECAERARPFLRLENERYHVNPAIVKQVQFEFLNLAMDVYPSYVSGTMGLDVILCRNVMIYFDRDTIRQVARRFYDSLAPGGWLITASGDPPMTGHADFESVTTNCGVFCRRPLEQPVSPQNSERPTVEWFQPSDPPPIPGFQQHPLVDTKPSSNEVQPKPDLTPSPNVHLELARLALRSGQYNRAVELTKDLSHNAEACVLNTKALANIDTLSAVRKCFEATKLHPVSTELHYLHAVLLMESNLDELATQAAQRVVFLDRSLAMAHFTLGSILQRRGSLDDARRHFRNTRNLCQQRPATEVMSLSEGETAQQLAEAATARLASIETAMR